MTCLVERFCRRMASFTQALLGMAKRIDYETLSRYMLDVSRMQDLPSIMHEAAKCMKEILDYKLFAFVVQTNRRLEVWIDPRIGETALNQIIQSDFPANAGFEAHYIHPEQEAGNGMIAFHEGQMLSFAIMDDHYFAKLYVLPERTMLDYHKDIIGIIIKSLGSAVSNYMNIKRLENDATIDPMTDCYNRRAFDRMIQHNIHNAHRYGRDLSIIMLDLDRFKEINDHYGHPSGDRVLEEVARLILRSIRKSDYVVRYGGEEFLVVLPDTKLSNAMDLAERLRSLIERSPIQIAPDQEIAVTASFGVAALAENSDAATLINEADTMLYSAKASGRNRVMPGIMLCVKESGRPRSRVQERRR